MLLALVGRCLCGCGWAKDCMKLIAEMLFDKFSKCGLGFGADDPLVTPTNPVAGLELELFLYIIISDSCCFCYLFIQGLTPQLLEALSPNVLFDYQIKDCFSIA